MHVRAVVTATVVAELVGLVSIGLITLLARLLLGDDSTDGVPPGVLIMFATWVAHDYYGKRPPHRRRGVPAGLAALGLVGVAGLEVAEYCLPGGTAENLLDALVLVIALPVANGVFAAVAGPPPGR
ncbi:hypothetical protein ABTX81_28115 [Kitasatospora sp. NPDC097605]|uniref:hypothetical protein n=1 Tax=Kitasatospora sp. NPDC097605 TaxID=3157226 RepID=UPI0033268DAC